MTKLKKGGAVLTVNLPVPIARKRELVRLVPVHAVEYDCVCWDCGAPFTSKRPDARYDSGACRARAYRKRKRERERMARAAREMVGIFADPLY